MTYISTFTALNSALSGIEAAQEELETTGNNITNASTPGYTDESVVLGENVPLVLPQSNGNTVEIGTGVDALKVVSSRNQFLDASYRAQNGVANSYQTVSSFLGEVQSDLNEGSDSTAGISAQLSTFWNDWTDLANNPTNTAAKQVVVNDGVTLAQSFNQLSANLASVKAQASAQYASLTGPSGQVASDANQIA
jgi:flagellar hook-associated protein 1